MLDKGGLKKYFSSQKKILDFLLKYQYTFESKEEIKFKLKHSSPNLAFECCGYLVTKINVN